MPGGFSATSPDVNSWDPALAVAPNGTVYASFMALSADYNTFAPVVDASFDHGRTFSQVSQLPVQATPAPDINWGDRDFIAVGRDGTVYVTWDYGPSYIDVANQILCGPTGSCSFGGGDFNAVIQKSTDGGKTWTPIDPFTPGFPIGGVDIAPIIVQPDGTLDVLYLGHPTDPSTHALSPGSIYFTRSFDDGQTWSQPLQVGPSAGTVELATWWIEPRIATDQAGNLYATWATQTATTDIGWLAYSTNGGSTWSAPIRVTPDQGKSTEILEAVGVRPGVAYVAWQTSAAPQGYATFVRPFSIDRGWLAPAPTQVSTQYGDPAKWPGDTFGISTLDGDGQGDGGPPAILSWGSAYNGQPSQIYSSVVTGLLSDKSERAVTASVKPRTRRPARSQPKSMRASPRAIPLTPRSYHDQQEER
jgi:hypothetical protein